MSKFNQHANSKSRPKYHYFYGATDDSTTDTPDSPANVSASETEVLIGESLVPTDNEEETPSNSVQDLTQIMVTNGRGQRQGTYLLDMSIPANPSEKPNSPRPRSIWTILAESCLNLSGNRPIGHIARIVVLMAIAICMFTLINVLSPSAPTSETGGAHKTNPKRSVFIPYEVVDRANFDDAAHSIVNPDLFDESLVFRAGRKGSSSGTSQRANTAVDPFLKVPFPTGAFWTNLVVEPASGADDLSYPIVSYPYAFKWSSSQLQASYPAIRRRVQAKSIEDIFAPDVTFGSLEKVEKRFVAKFDPLSVTLKYVTENDGSWETYIVQGTPYITIKYTDATPILSALSTFLNVMCPFDEDGKYNDGDSGAESFVFQRNLKWGVCTPSQSENAQNAGSSTLYGVQFLLQTQEELTWILFASEPLALTFDSQKRAAVESTGKFTGVLRLALIPPTPDRTSKPNATSLLPLSESTGLRRLVYHAGTYPTGGSVSWEFRSAVPPSALALKTVAGTTPSILGVGKGSTYTDNAGRIGSVHFDFETSLMSDNANSRPNSGGTPLLMLALPHHANLLKDESQLMSSQFDLLYRSIKGVMTPVVGSAWSYEEKLPDIKFDDQKFDGDKTVKELLLQNLREDIQILKPNADENIYGMGKQVARIAQLAHISSVLLSSDSTARKGNETLSQHYTSDLMQNIASELQIALEMILDSDIEDKLIFDGKFGGIVSQDGLSDPGADFGNGRYNDHHFHYGYLLYASAVMGRLNETFVDDYGAHVDNLLFDIAYHSNGDSSAVDGVFFPLARYKSWYDGHSFATGLFPFANGKSQESTSEAVNAYYGAYLWSLVRSTSEDELSSSNSADFSKLLMMMEIRGAQWYWHMLPSELSPISDPKKADYDEAFAKNYMVGNLGMLDAVASTWFGDDLLYVHMINFLPVTGATGLLFEREYVDIEYKKVLEPLGDTIPAAWKGYTICNEAIIDPMTAWEKALTLKSAELDSALSKSQVLYWIATRPGFSISKISNGNSTYGNANGNTTVSTAAGSTNNSSCLLHPQCTSIGLTGMCCPTLDGLDLDCCA